MNNSDTLLRAILVFLGVEKQNTGIKWRRTYVGLRSWGGGVGENGDTGLHSWGMARLSHSLSQIFSYPSATTEMFLGSLVDLELLIQGPHVEFQPVRQ